MNKNLLLLIVLAILCIASFVGGIVSSRSAVTKYGEGIRFVQANSTYNNLIVLMEIDRYIDAGCLRSAGQAINNELEISQISLARHIEMFPDGAFTKLLSERDPEMLANLHGVIVPLPKTYRVAPCTTTNQDQP